MMPQTQPNITSHSPHRRRPQPFSIAGLKQALCSNRAAIGADRGTATSALRGGLSAGDSHR